ncbi:MAG: hypothetical protein HOO93_17560 [Methyloglobulus sp.]|nr:hypothetical protein [Methyloglobulus sp.]
MTRKQAEAAYLDWKESIPASILNYFADLDRAEGSWHTEVFNYFDHRITNDYAESANNHIKNQLLGKAVATALKR